jgi:hypothetical protein
MLNGGSKLFMSGGNQRKRETEGGILRVPLGKRSSPQVIVEAKVKTSCWVRNRVSIKEEQVLGIPRSHKGCINATDGDKSRNCLF